MRVQTRLLLCSCAVSIGCATTSADFKLANIGKDEAAIAGRLTIVYNGQTYTENCYATFGGRRLKMTKDGVVLFIVRRGHTALERLDCEDVSNQHIEIDGVHFVARGDGVVTDFGDVAVTWEAAGGFKASALFGMIGAIVDEASDDGVATTVVRPPVAEVREAFKAQTGVDGVWSQTLVPMLAQPARPTPPVAPTVAPPPMAAASCQDTQPDSAGPCAQQLR